MKKISAILLIIMLMNLIFADTTFATDTESDSEVDRTTTYNKDSYDMLTNDGKVELEGTERNVGVSQSGVAANVGLVNSAITPIGITTSILLTDMVQDGGLYRTDSEYSTAETGYLTVEGMVFGEYLLFDTKLYQSTEDLNPEREPTEMIKLIDNIKGTVLGWFNAVNGVASVIFLILFLQAGVKTVMNSSDDEKHIGKLMKMTQTWFVAFAFTFAVPYIVIFINRISDLLLDIFWNVRLTLENSGYSSFEVALFEDLYNKMTFSAGLKMVAYSIEYIAFIILQAIFFVKYFFRVLMAFKLILLAPVTAIRHVLVVFNNKEGNVLIDWIIQYATNIFIQPIHAVLYLVLLFTVSEIAIKAPLLGVVFIWALLRSEKIVKLLFNINNGKLLSI